MAKHNLFRLPQDITGLTSGAPTRLNIITGEITGGGGGQGTGDFPITPPRFIGGDPTTIPGDKPGPEIEKIIPPPPIQPPGLRGLLPPGAGIGQGFLKPFKGRGLINLEATNVIGGGEDFRTIIGDPNLIPGGGGPPVDRFLSAPPAEQRSFLQKLLEAGLLTDSQFSNLMNAVAAGTSSTNAWFISIWRQFAEQFGFGGTTKRVPSFGNIG